MVDAGGCVTYVEQRPHEAIFIPTGHIVLEKAITPALVYGLRRPLIIQGKTHAEAYASMISMYRAGSKPLGKMDEALKVMQALAATFRNRDIDSTLQVRSERNIQHKQSHIYKD